VKLLHREEIASSPHDAALREDKEPTQQKIAYEARTGRNDFAEYRGNAGETEANRQAIIHEPHQGNAAKIGGDFTERSPAR
jgi:hypothetical protein